MLVDMKNKNINFLMSKDLQLSANVTFQQTLNELSIPYFFVNRKSVALEYNKFTCKQMLNELDIPTGKSIGNTQVNGKYIFDNFMTIQRPFVIKLYPYQYGRQTVIVTDENKEEVFLDLFSGKIGKDYRVTNINDEWSAVLEEFIDIKQELSCHFLVNETGWSYIGSARDYKKLYDGDKGPNSFSSGAYNVHEIDPRIHDYTDRIFNFLKKNKYEYKGFLFLGIALGNDGVPIVLEINTRSGDPELDVIIGSITSNISELFLAGSCNDNFPKIVHDTTKKIVTVGLLNKVYDWNNPASDLPRLGIVPDNIIHCRDGYDPSYLRHSVFVSTSNTHIDASTQIYDYLNDQYLGQYRYRTDIGLLK
jgi:phosphoribosylamine--glycine ligase